MTFSVDLEFKEFKERIEQFQHEMPRIAKKMLTAVFSRMKKDAKENAPVRTGRLQNSVDFHSFNDWSGSLTTWKKNKKSGLKNLGFHASFYEDGVAGIRAKDNGTKTIRFINKRGTPVMYENKYLTFKINGEWKKVSARGGTPKKPFMRPVFDTYFGGGAELGIKLMDKRLQKEMDKILKEKEKEKEGTT
jgi:hypothetical protein